MKWMKYKIDYEYGTAVVITKDRSKDPLNLFYSLAGDCFGIRKSIGETKLLDEELIDFSGKERGEKNTGEQIMAGSLGDYTNVMLHSMFNREADIDVPEENMERVSHILAHNGDVIVFTDTEFDGGYWKLKNEHGNWCTCKKEGKPELSCENHHFWVKNHDKKCNCLKRDSK